MQNETTVEKLVEVDNGNPPMTKEQEALIWCRAHADTVHDSLNTLFGLRGWYGAYILSDDFTEQNPSFKKESFQIYSDLVDFLNRIDEMRIEQD